MLPVISQDLALDKNQSASLLLAGLIVTPQIIAAVSSPWVGYHAEKFGRKPLLLIGFGVEALRGLVFARRYELPRAGHRPMPGRDQRRRRHRAHGADDVPFLT